MAKLARPAPRASASLPWPGPSAPAPENFFSEFQVEGVSEDNNAIYVELAAENRSRALNTAQNARALKVRRTHQHFPSGRCPWSW